MKIYASRIVQAIKRLPPAKSFLTSGYARISNVDGKLELATTTGNEYGIFVVYPFDNDVSSWDQSYYVQIELLLALCQSSAKDTIFEFDASEHSHLLIKDGNSLYRLANNPGDWVDRELKECEMPAHLGVLEIDCKDLFNLIFSTNFLVSKHNFDATTSVFMSLKPDAIDVMATNGNAMIWRRYEHESIAKSSDSESDILIYPSGVSQLQKFLELGAGEYKIFIGDKYFDVWNDFQALRISIAPSQGVYPAAQMRALFCEKSGCEIGISVPHLVDAVKRLSASARDKGHDSEHMQILFRDGELFEAMKVSDGQVFGDRDCSFERICNDLGVIYASKDVLMYCLGASLQKDEVCITVADNIRYSFNSTHGQVHEKCMFMGLMPQSA